MFLKMAAIDVDSLTDSEIRLKFSELGCPVGPVTSTTRKILLKKLRTLIEEGGNQSINSDNFHTGHETNFEVGNNEESTKYRRRSLPRTSNKSKSRSPSRPNVSSTQSDYTTGIRSVDQRPDLRSATSPGVSNESKRITRSTIPIEDTNISYLSPLNYNNYETPKIVSDVSSPQNYGNSDSNSRSNASRYLNSGLGLGLNDNFRSRFNESSKDTELNLSLNQSGSSQSFSSDFVKRLSASRNSQRSEFRSPICGITSKLLDVKESDDEDTGPTPVYAKFSQSGSRGSPVASIKNIRITPSESWLPFDSTISTILLLIFILFFVVIGVTYVSMHSSDTDISSPTDLIFPICLNMPSHVPGENCLKETDRDTVLKLFNIVYKELHDTVINGPCNGRKVPIVFTDDDIVNMIVEKDKKMSVWVVEQHLKNLKVLLDANPKWKIKPTGHGISIVEAPDSYYCLILNNMYFVGEWIIRIALGCIISYVGYLAVRWWMLREARYKEDVYKLVSSIIDIVSSRAQTPDSCIPITHVRDQLILPKDRARLNKLWQDALTLLESDSRLRCEIQEVEGEEFLVWRWLATSLNSSSKRKVWQGQAFDTMEGSVNSLPNSPTSCLKIRHMFDAFLEEGDDWVTTVVNAILEKCGGAKILHVVVDKQSREGCVYMKCASPLDAGIAYRSLHGSWFDSNLVTVKYIREKRYLERFPESASCSQPLHPTNTNKNS